MKSFSPIIAVALLASNRPCSTNAFYASPRIHFTQKSLTPQHIPQNNDVFESSFSKNTIQGRSRNEDSKLASRTALGAVPGWVAVAGISAPILSVILSISPLPTVLSIIKKKSVGDLPLLPYSSLVANR